MYEFDAGKVTPFRRTGQVASENGYNELKADAPGWSTEVYDPTGKGDFAAVREGTGGAIGVAATGEKNASQLAFRSHELPADPVEEGKRYTVVLEYRTDRGVDGYTSVQTMDDWKTIGGATLSDTGGEWRTSTYSFTRPAGQKVQLTMGPKVANGRFVWVRRVYLTREDVEAKTPPPPPASKPGVPVVAVKADFAALKDETQQLAQAAVTIGGDWLANTFDSDATGELTVTAEDGAKAVSLVNTTGTPSAQLYQSKPGGTLAAGTAYLLKLEYKAAEGTSGVLEVREKDVGNWKDCPHSFKLQATGDKWEKRTFEVETDRDYPTVFVVQNLSDATGNRLTVRSVELVPVGK